MYGERIHTTDADINQMYREAAYRLDIVLWWGYVCLLCDYIGLMAALTLDWPRVTLFHLWSHAVGSAVPHLEAGHVARHVHTTDRADFLAHRHTHARAHAVAYENTTPTKKESSRRGAEAAEAMETDRVFSGSAMRDPPGTFTVLSSATVSRVSGRGRGARGLGGGLRGAFDLYLAL